MLMQFANAACLLLEANQVVWMRMMGLYRAEPLDLVAETALMISEKIEAACSAGSSLAVGGSIDEVVTAYREVVQANIKRLSA